MEIRAFQKKKKRKEKNHKQNKKAAVGSSQRHAISYLPQLKSIPELHTSLLIL